MINKGKFIKIDFSVLSKIIIKLFSPNRKDDHSNKKKNIFKSTL